MDEAEVLTRIMVKCTRMYFSKFDRSELILFGPLIKTLNLSCLLLKECIDR